MQNLQDLILTVVNNVEDVKTYCSKDVYEQVLDTVINTLLDVYSKDEKMVLVDQARNMLDVNKYHKGWDGDLLPLNDHILYWVINNQVEFGLGLTKQNIIEH